MIIPCISLWQPWCSLLAHGKKKIETRSWEFRGKMPVVLAVHATASWNRDALFLCRKNPFLSAVKEITGAEDLRRSIDALPLAAVLGLIRLTHCVRTDWLTPGTSATSFPQIGTLTETEREFGDFRPGRYCWITDKAVAFPEPIPARGRQMIWNWHCGEYIKKIADSFLREE